MTPCASVPVSRSAHGIHNRPTRFRPGFCAWLVLVLLPCLSLAEPYTWDNVRVGGGGYVTGIVIHPQNENLWYARTDVGGIYRYDDAQKKMVQLINFPTPAQRNWYGGYGVDVHPTDQNVVYAALGMTTGGTPVGDVFKSVNKGETWTRLNLNKKMQSNDNTNGYKTGKPLVVNPHNPRYVFCGTYNDGLWIYDNNTGLWTEATGLPTAATAANRGRVQNVVFDPTNPQRAYVAVAYTGTSTGMGVYRSTDGGFSFTPIGGSTTVTRLALASDGSKLYAAAKDGIKRLDNPATSSTWTTINTPEGAVAHRAFAIDPTNNSKIYTAPKDGGSPNFRLYVSTDSGANWTLKTSSFTRTVPWHTAGYPGQAPSEIAIAPSNPSVAMFGDFFSLYRTTNLSAEPVAWSNQVALGHEEVCVITLVTAKAPSRGFLFSGHADVSGMRHESLSEYPVRSIGDAIGKEITGLAVAPSDTNRVYALGAGSWSSGPANFGYSDDNGQTFTRTQASMAWGWGRLAVSATNKEHVVALTRDAGVQYSLDGGVTFAAPATGGPIGTLGSSTTSIFSFAQPLAADGATGGVFYIWHAGAIHKTTNSGKDWAPVTIQSGSIAHTAGAGSVRGIIGVPGKANHLWLTRGIQGLARTTDGGANWTTNTNPQQADMVAVGMAAPSATYPAVYIYGRANGDTVQGFYRSVDEGATWLRINDANSTIGNNPEAMAADQQTFGRLYVGTNGTGIWYGTPAGTAGLVITTPVLAQATTGVPYNQALAASGGTAPLTWAIDAGALPAGLSLSSAGVISGTPTAAGTTTFTVRVSDAATQTSSEVFSITTVAPTIVGDFIAQDVGTTGAAGSASFANGTYTVDGAGANIWTGTDAFHFLYQAWDGDATLIARVASLENTHANAKAGLMIRKSLTAGSAHATIDIAPAGFGVEFLRRVTDGSTTTGQDIAGSISPPRWLKLVRSGDNFTAFHSSNGATWTQLGSSVSIPLGSGSVYVGLVVCSHQSGTLATGTFDNVSVSGNEGPAVALTSPTEGASVVAGAMVSLSATATDADGVTAVDFYADDEVLIGTDNGAPFTVSWAPTVGTYELTAVATDGRGAIGVSSPITITVTENFVPEIATTALSNGITGAAYSATLAASGGNGALSWSLASGTLPAGLTLSSGGVISGTPSAAGTASFTVRVADADGVTGAGDEDTQALTLVIGANSVPAISTTTLPGTVTGAVYSRTLAATGGNGALVWSVASGALPAGLTLSSTGVISGTSTTAGTASFTVKVADTDAVTGAGDEDTQALSIVVTANSVPVISTTTLPNGTSWTAYSQTLAATGGNGTRVWSLAAGNLPPGISLSSGGVVSGTPSAAGSYFFTVRAADSDDHTGSADTDTQDLVLSVNGTAGASTVGAFTSEDIGSPGLTGAASLNTTTGVYIVRGGGADIYGTADQFRFLHQAWNGNVRLIARVDSLQNTDPKSKAGLMIRESTAAGSRNTNLVLTAAHGVEMLHRGTASGVTTVDSVGGAAVTAPYWLKLERHGSTFIGWQSPDGELWFHTGSTTFTMNTTGTRVGLAVTAHNNALMTSATFSNVSVSNVPTWTAADIGTTGTAGSTSVNYGTDLFTLNGAGGNIYYGTDAFHFYYQTWTAGDATLVAEVNTVGNTHQYAKAGLMIRQNLTATSAHATIDLTPGNAVEFLRRTANGATVTDNTLVTVPAGSRFLKLVRTGHQFTAYHSPDGGIWTQLGSPVAITMSGTVYVGLINCSHVSGTLSTATFSSVYFR